MYKALVLANTLDIVNKETRWDEGLSRSEAIQLLADTYAKLAEAKGYPIDTTLGKTNITETVEDTDVDNTATDAENTTTSEAQSKSEINENDSQTSEGEVYEEVTETPAPEVNNSSSSYVMSDELKQDLKTLGATDAEIAAIKSEKDMTDLVDKLITGGTTGNSGSTAGGGSSSTDTGSSGSIGDGNDNDLPIFELGSEETTLKGSM